MTEGRILVFSRQPLRSRPLHEWLAEVRSRLVLVTTQAAVRDAPVDPATVFADVHAVTDYRSWRTEVEAEELARRHRVTAVASSSEDDVLRAARLRDRLGLAGQDLASATAYRDKVAMKLAARAAGVPVPAFMAWDSPLDLLDFVAEHGLPVVVKPRRGSGSRRVHILRDDRDVAAVLAAGLLPAAPDRSGEWMVEAFVDAPLCHVDGVMCDGRILHCWPSRYSSGNEEIARTRVPLSSVMLDPDDPDRPVLTGFAADVIAALPATPYPTSFHLEAFRPPGGRPLLCEIASRTGGAGVAPAQELSFGVHLSRQSLRGQCGLPLSLAERQVEPDPPTGWIMFTRGQGVYTPPAGPAPVAEAKIDHLLAAGSVSQGAEHVCDAAASAIVWGESARIVRERVEQLLGWWAGSDVWRPGEATP